MRKLTPEQRSQYQRMEARRLAKQRMVIRGAALDGVDALLDALIATLPTKRSRRQQAFEEALYEQKLAAIRGRAGLAPVAWLLARGQAQMRAKLGFEELV
jgi:hypothetical protein